MILKIYADETVEELFEAIGAKLEPDVRKRIHNVNHNEGEVIPPVPFLAAQTDTALTTSSRVRGVHVQQGPCRGGQARRGGVAVRDVHASSRVPRKQQRYIDWLHWLDWLRPPLAMTPCASSGKPQCANRPSHGFSARRVVRLLVDEA